MEQRFKKSDFITNNFMFSIKGDQNVSSSMLDTVFVLGNRVPKNILEKMKDHDTAEKVITQMIPLTETTITKPYWDEGSSLHIGVYNSICLAKDRELLDFIIAYGSLMNDPEKYTLRQVVELGWKITNVDWEAYHSQKKIDEPLNNKGNYYYIPVSTLFKAMNIKPSKFAREDLKNRFKRLKSMRLDLTPSIDGKIQRHLMNEFNIIDKDIHYLLDKDKIRNKNYNLDTYTDIIINIDDFYLSSLEDNGVLSRARIQNHYVYLHGSNDIIDFYKYLDSHKRSWINGKFLSKIIIKYYDNKISTFSLNRAYKLKQLYDQVVKEEAKLYKHFNFYLNLSPGENQVYVKKDTDFKFEHSPTP
jgi:hypothetical protein